MSSEIVRSGFDTWAGSASPALAHPREAYWRLDSGEAMAYLWFKVPAPRGATITSATLTIRSRGGTSGSWTLSAQRCAASWNESRLTWNNKPAVTGTAATATVGTVGAGGSITIDVTAIVQAWANGSANYGLRLSSNSTTARLFHSLNSAYKPTLSVTWSDAPAKPTNLRPSEAATSLAKPHLVFDYKDVSGDTSLAAVQVQTSATSSFTSPAFDSGEVATTSAGLDLATTAFAGLTEGQTVYWRVRAKDGAGLWSTWSDTVTMTRTAKPTVTIANLGAGVAYEPSPPILWSTTGTQTRWRVLVYDTADLSRAVHDSKERAGSETAYTIPSGALIDDRTYRVVVRVWDNVAREATPGDDTYAFAQADFTVDTDPSVGPVDTLTAVQQDLTPWVELTWTRSTTPDGFVLVRDGKVVRELDPADVFVSGSTYALTYYGARPNRPHTYHVRAIVNGKQSPNGPAAALTTSPSGLWIVDFDRGVDVTLWGNEEGSWSATDDASVYTPVGSTQVVRIVNGLRGLEGNLSGLLMEGFGKTFDQMEESLYEIKARPSQTVRIIAGDENFTALVGNIRISPKPETRQGRIVKGVSFDFWQVGALPFDAEI